MLAVVFTLTHKNISVNYIIFDFYDKLVIPN